jgi:hypothetical protein
MARTVSVRHRYHSPHLLRISTISWPKYEEPSIVTT